MTNPYAPPQTVVRDIVVADADIVLADRGARLGAAMLDSLIVGVMVYAPLVFTVLASGAMQAPAGEHTNSAIVGGGIALTLVCFGVWLWFTIKLVKRNGQSIAKKAVGIKVVRSDGSPVSAGRVIWVRNVVNMLLSVIPLYGLIDSIFIFGEARRCLHDRLADTIVVKA
jgi:uncharacterized RDD family membrane protein YckC